MEHFEKTWRYDPQGKREYTLMQLRNPITDGLQKSGFHLSQGDASLDPRDVEMRDLCSFRSVLHESSACQTVDEQWYQDKDTRIYP